LAALKKSPKELDSLAKDIETFDKKIKTDEKVSAFIGKLIRARIWSQD
jgi:F-type H+-transporting ATPase subunit O